MEIKNSSRMCEIIQSYDEFKERIAKELTELSRKMIAEKNMSSMITEIEVRPMYSEETPFRISYTLNYDGLLIAKSMGIKGDEDLNDNIEIIIKNTQYDLKLIDEYPDVIWNNDRARDISKIAFSSGALWRINSVWHKPSAYGEELTRNVEVIAKTKRGYRFGKFDVVGYSHEYIGFVSTSSLEYALSDVLEYAYLADLLPERKEEKK